MCGLRKPLALSMAMVATGGAKYGLQGETLVSAVYIGWVPFCVSGAQSAYLGALEGPISIFGSAQQQCIVTLSS
jgi:hypothetical protein